MVSNLQSYARLLTLCHISVFYCKHIKKLNLFISGISRSKIIIFQFFGFYIHFFLELMETHLFWARPFKITQAFFPALGLLFWMRS